MTVTHPFYVKSKSSSGKKQVNYLHYKITPIKLCGKHYSANNKRKAFFPKSFKTALPVLELTSFVNYLLMLKQET